MKPAEQERTNRRSHRLRMHYSNRNLSADSAALLHPVNKPKAAFAILYAGAVCGVLDITAACINAWLASGFAPEHVLQSVAGGLLGRRTYEGGLATASLGLVMHFTMALTVTTAFYLLTRRFPLPRKLAAVIAVGLLYGLAVFAVNNFGTASFLSWVRSLYLRTPILFKPPMGWSQLVIHLFRVGLPIALVTRRYASSSDR